MTQQPMQAPVEQRSGDRFGLALPITMEGDEAEGATHDLSANGILFESRSEPPVGSQVTVKLHYEAGGKECALACDGQVVRVERHGESYNIAVKLHKPLFE